MAESHPRQGVAGTSTPEEEINVRYEDKEYADKTWLSYFIEERGKDVQEIADYCDMSSTGILYHVRKHGIDTGHDCPECGIMHATEEGKKRHASMEHDLNLRGKPAECKRCGDSFRSDPGSRTYFCSSDCSEAHESEKHAKNRITKDCQSCGESFEVKPCRKDTAKYCSNPCKTRDTVAGWNKKEHPELECECCGDTYTVPPYAEDNSRYCSKQCTFKAYETRYRGEGNPFYKGGGPWNYGPNWDEQAEKARERDNHECQLCGLEQSESRRALSVHHKIPKRKFIDENGGYDWKRGNQLDNLITLCDSCHGRYGWWGVLPPSAT